MDDHGNRTDGRRARRVFLRLELAGGARLGPGKIRLLEQVRDTGSISAAGRSMGMSYRRAWLLVDSLNRSFRRPLVVTQSGGRHGGGAVLTDFGADVVARFRAMEADTERLLATPLAALEAELADEFSPRPAPVNRAAR